MRILMVCYEYPPLGGGGGRVVQGLAKELIQRGHQIDLVTTGFRGLPAREEQPGLRIFRVRSLRTRLHMCTIPEALSYVVLAIPVVLRLAWQNRYAINHTHFILPDGILAWLARALAGLPYVLTAHGSDVPGYNPDRLQLAHRLMTPCWRVIVRGARSIICPSETLQRLIASHDRRARTTVVPNGIVVTAFSTHARRREGVLIVTRMFERKGVQYALEALRGLEERPRVRIAGDGPYLPALKALAGRLGVQAEFAGWLDHGSPTLWELYDSSRIFVFPSVGENFPLVLLEAMAAGLAIITTQGTGCAEVVGDTALLVPPRDARAIRQALERLLGDEALCRRLGEAARARLVERFSWPSVADQHEALYRAHAR